MNQRVADALAGQFEERLVCLPATRLRAVDRVRQLVSESLQSLLGCEDCWTVEVSCFLLPVRIVDRA